MLWRSQTTGTFRSATYLVLSAAAAGLVGCGATTTTEDRVMNACTTTIDGRESTYGMFKYANYDDYIAHLGDEVWELRVKVHDLKFTDMIATLETGDGPTKTYLVKGVGSATRTLDAPVGQYDEDGKPDELAPVSKHIECEVGYRESDDSVTVFEYRSPRKEEVFNDTTLVTRAPASPG